MKWQLHLKCSIYIKLTLTIFCGFIIYTVVEAKYTNSSCIEKENNR